MLKSSICKSFGIIQFSIEAYYSGDFMLPEVWEISLWSMVWIAYSKREENKKKTQQKRVRLKL